MEHGEGVNAKTHEVFAFAGERRGNIDPIRSASEVIATIEAAIRSEYGEKALDIAFNLSDWKSDAAFLVAVHLFPERFSAEEIREGVERVLIHAPNHLAAAAALAGYPVKDVYGIGFKVPPDDDDD